MIDTNLEMTDKIGYLLFKKGIIDAAILEKALAKKANDKFKIKRNLAQILVEDFNYEIILVKKREIFYWIKAFYVESWKRRDLQRKYEDRVHNNSSDRS